MSKEIRNKNDKKNMKKKKEMFHGDMKQDLSLIKEKVKKRCMK